MVCLLSGSAVPHSGRLSFVAAACVLVLVLVALPHPGASQVLPQGFEGDWHFAGGARERQRLSQAIDSVVGQLNVFIRGLARREMHRNIQPEPRISIDIQGSNSVRLTLGTWGPHRVVLDGRMQGVRGPDGSDTRLQALYDGQRIVIRQHSPRGLRESWLSLAESQEPGPPEWLFMQVRVASDQLPTPVRYTLSYRRTGRSQ